MPGCTKNRISVLLSSEEFEAFDRYCRRHAWKKSTLLRKMIQERLKRGSFEARSALREDREEPLFPVDS